MNVDVKAEKCSGQATTAATVPTPLHYLHLQLYFSFFPLITAKMKLKKKKRKRWLRFKVHPGFTVLDERLDRKGTKLMVAVHTKQLAVGSCTGLKPQSISREVFSYELIQQVKKEIK